MSIPPDAWSRLKDVFDGARALAVDVRPAYLDAACAGDERLRRDAEVLLASHDRATSFLETPAVLFAATAPVKTLEGQRIGPYQLTSRIGAGGMGEVYCARDTTLNRDVALKVLPEVFAGDADRLARFRREAQLLATLNHPNIAAIYGLEELHGAPVLVLELVEGVTLGDVIARGPLSLDEALPIARQIAEALEAAHDKGIIHRDIKPANITIDRNRGVKVLDFGLAKVWDGASESDLAASPRLTTSVIGGQALLGTPTYMSPEQARGQSLDRRTDIWSFGCVLYEMLTGRAPFARDTISDTVVAILEHDADWTLPATTPVPIRRLLRRCLEKDRTRRLDSAAGARLEIDDAVASPRAETLAFAATPSRRVTPVTLAALSGVAVLAALVVWAQMRREPQAPVPSSRFVIVASPALPLNVSSSDRDLAVSPDGRNLVYRAGGAPTVGAALMVRATDRLDARQLPGASALGVFVSPDSRWIGFFTPTELKKVSITGGPVITVGRVTGASLGASWGDDNTIVFATDDPKTGLWRVSANGGEPTVLTTPDVEKGESDHGFPAMLPGGRGVLFTITAVGQADNAQVAVLDLSTGRRKTLVGGGSQAEYVDPSAGTGQAGYLIYAASGTLRAVRFDPVRLEVLGEPVTVIEHVMIKPNGAANYAVSRQGTLFYVPGGVSEQMSPRSLVWVDRTGHEDPVNAPLRAYSSPRISPDGTRLLFGIIDQDNDIWMWDTERETLKRLTFGPGSDPFALWTPDGRQIVFPSNRAGVFNLYTRAADGTGQADRLTTGANRQFLSSISPDGSLAVGFERVSIAASAQLAPGTAWRVRLYSLGGAASRAGLDPSLRPSPDHLETPALTLFDGAWAEFSPNGRYLVYMSALGEPGRSEVYVRPFPQVDSGRWQITTTGGSRPTWARSGRELFYLDASNTLTAVPVETSGSTFSVGKPARVFDAKYAQPFPSRSYDVSPDGQRFLMLKDSAVGNPSTSPASMVVVEHWFEELKQRLGSSGRSPISP